MNSMRQRQLAVRARQPRMQHARGHAQQHRHERIGEQDEGVDPDARRGRRDRRARRRPSAGVPARRRSSGRAWRGRSIPTRRCATGSIAPGSGSAACRPSSPPTACSTSGSAIANPTSFTVSCTTFTHADDVQAAGREVDRDDERAERAADDLRRADRPRSRIQAIPISWPARMQTRADPEQRGDGRAHAAVVAPLEKVADRPQIVLRGDPADARPDPQREHERAERRPIRPTTPPRGRRDSRARWRRSSIRRRCSPPARSRTAGPDRARARRRRSRSTLSSAAPIHTPSAICAIE